MRLDFALLVFSFAFFRYNKPEMAKQTFFITTPIYYVNDAPHLGHAYTTIAADALARFWRARGADVFFLTGTDEHGAKVARSAHERSVEPQVFVDQVAGQYERAWATLGITYDRFIRTTEPEHITYVQAQFLRLKKDNYLYEGDYGGLYCVGCEEYKNEAELVDGKCAIHQTAVEKVQERIWFFKLSVFQKQIISAIEKDELKILPLKRKNEALQFIKAGLKDIPFTRTKVNWGIPLPWDKSQTVYVWVDALFNYLSAHEAGWPADVQLLGKDILRFHAVIWPALLLALGKALPKKLFVHGYFTVDGKKMSKTTGNTVDPAALSKKWGNDALRYFLLREFPLGSDGDFSEEKLAQRYNADLANGLGNLLSRVVAIAKQTNLPTKPTIKVSCAGADQAIEQLNFSGALDELWQLVTVANQAIEKEKLWELKTTDGERKTHLKQALRSLCNQLNTIATSLAPLMPTTSAQIIEQLKTGKAAPLFPRR